MSRRPRSDRPFRATVYLPGHDETGRSPKVKQLSATTEEGLEQTVESWQAQGYRVRSYEVLTLDLDLMEGDQ